MAREEWEDCWRQLKTCELHFNIDELVKTGKELLEIGNERVNEGFLIMAREDLEKAGEHELISRLVCKTTKEKDLEQDAYEKITIPELYSMLLQSSSASERKRIQEVFYQSVRALASSGLTSLFPVDS